MVTLGKKVKINDIIVEPIKKNATNPDKILGYDIFPDPYSNIFLCAKKRSGKTSTLFSILKKCAGKDTKILIFASTVFKDDNYKAIMKYFKSKQIVLIPKTHFINEGVNELENLIKSLEKENEDSEESEDDEITMLADDLTKFREIKEKKKISKLAPEFIFVFDDLSKDLRNKCISALLKKNRHFKCKTIISSQTWSDIDQEGRNKIDYCILFQGHSKEKLELIHKDLDLSIPFDEFLAIYYNATAEKYHFLYIDVRECSFRQDFNKLFVIV